MATPRGRRKHWQWALVLPFLGLVYPPLYARGGPHVLSVPFVVWYQFLLVLVGLGVSAVAFVAVEGLRRPEPALAPVLADPAALSAVGAESPDASTPSNS